MVGTRKNGLTVLLVAVLFACLAALSFFVPTKGVSAADGTEGSPSDAVMTAEDLQSDISAAEAGGIVALTGNVNGNITVGADADVIIDLNGFEITSSTQGMPTVKNEGKLKIVDNSADKTGIITRENTATYYVVVNEGDLTLDGVTVRNDNAADTSSLLENNFDCAQESAATLTIESGTYYCAGGNVVKNENYGTLNINDGKFTSDAIYSGGRFSVLLVVGTANITNGTFISTAAGDGVRVMGTNGSTATLDITGGTFTVTASGAKALLLQNGDEDIDKGTLDVNIGGGTFNGDIGVDAHSFGVTETDEITISDGTFNGSVNPGVTIKSEITGGIFSEIVDATYYPADFVLCVNDEGKYTVAQPDSIPSGWQQVVVGAEMSGQSYSFASLQEALDEAKRLSDAASLVGNVQISLLGDIAENIIIPFIVNSRNVELRFTINLHGYKIIGADNTPVITNNGKLTLSNPSGISGGSVVRDSDTQGVVIENNGTISFNNRGFIIENNNTADESYLIENNGMLTFSSSATYGLNTYSAAGGNLLLNNEGGKATLSGGNFVGAIMNLSAADGSVAIKGGTYSEIPDYKYFANGYVWTKNDSGTFDAVKSENGFVAVIGNIGYTSLAEAVWSTDTGDVDATVITIIGEGNVVNGAGVKFDGQNVIIDLNGKTYNVINPTVGSPGTETNGFQMLKGSKVVFRNGALTSDVAKILLQNYCDLTLENVTINATGSSSIQYIASNNNGSFTAVGNTQLIAGEGQVAFDVYYNLGGSYPDGVTVTFGEDFTGKVTGKVEYGVSNAVDGWEEKTVLNISGGEFDITISPSGTTAQDANINISGGDFTQAFDGAYLASDAVLYPTADGAFAVADQATAEQETIGVAQIGQVIYETLADAVEAAREGDTVKLLANVNESIVIAAGQDITIDLSGFTLTGEGDHTIINNGTLTITDGSAAKSGAVDNVTHGRGALVNNGTAILNGGAFKRSAEAGVSATDNGGNSWYVIENHGTLTINDGVAVYHGTSAETAAQWKYSSLIRNVGTSADATATLTANGGEFYTGRIALKNDDYGTLTVNGGQISSGNQAVQNWYKAAVNGGTFNGQVITWFYGSNIGAAAMTINDGIFNAQVKSVDYDAGADGVYPMVDEGTAISGGKFAVMPNEAYFIEGLTGALVDGYYVTVKATSPVEELRPAIFEAQAAVRSYAAALGINWADIASARAADAQAVLAAYDAIESAASVDLVLVAQLNAMDALDKYAAALAAALDAYKAEKIAALETLAGDGYVPAYAIAAINGAASVAEVDACYNAAVAEINAADDGDGVSLTGVYVMLGVILVVAVAALMILLLKKQKQAEAAEAAEAKAAAPLDRELAEVKQAVEADETAAAVSAAAEDDDKEQIVIEANVRTFDEAYDELDDEQKKLFNDVKDYALTKEGAALTELSSGVCVKKGSKQIVKLTVRRGNPVALFVIENEMIKDFRRNSDAPVKLKVKATELVLRSGGDLEAAKAMVDVAVDQIEKDILAAKERRREARRLRRQRKREQKRQ